MKTIWAGFERFCAAVDFAPDVLLGWWSGAGEYVERGRAVLDGDLPIDEAAADEMCAGYLHIWHLWKDEAG